MLLPSTHQGPRLLHRLLLPLLKGRKERKAPAALILAVLPVSAPLRPCPWSLLLPAHSLFQRTLAHLCDFKTSSLMIRNESLSASWTPPAAASIRAAGPRDDDLPSDTSHVQEQSHHLLQTPPSGPLGLVRFKGPMPGCRPGRDAGAVLSPPSLPLTPSPDSSADAPPACL